MLEYTYNSLMEEYSRINSLLIYDEMSRYINENIIDLSYTFDSIFTEEGEDNSEDDEETDKEEDKSVFSNALTKSDDNKEVSTTSSNTKEIDIKKNNEKLDPRKWYQKVWDMICYGWKWLITNIKRLFLKITGKDLQKVYYYNAGKINARIDDLIKQIENRNKGNSLENKSDIKRIKEICSIINEELTSFINTIELNPSEIKIQAGNKEIINLATAVQKVLNGIKEQQKYYEKISKSENGNDLFQAYIKYLKHIKFLTSKEIVDSYQVQNKRITAAYYRLSGLVDLIINGFKSFEKAKEDSAVSNENAKLFLNAFGVGKDTKEKLQSNSINEFNLAKTSLGIKLAYVYSFEDENDCKSFDAIDNIAPNFLKTEDMNKFCKAFPDFEKNFTTYLNNSVSLSEALKQHDISDYEKKNKADEITIEGIKNMFNNTDVNQTKSLWTRLFEGIGKGNNSEINKDRINSFLSLLVSINKAALGVIKLSVVSSKIDSRLIMLLNIEEI